MTARLHRGKAAELYRHLGTRDLAVLKSLHRLRVLTTHQLQRLHVFDGSPAAQLRRTQYLLRRLLELRLVVRLSRSIGGKRAGSAGSVYGISGFGQAVLDVVGPYGRRRRVWENTPRFQDHMLAGSEFYVRLTELERLGQIEILSFQSEPHCWRHLTGPGGELVVIKPDAYVSLGLGQLALSAFVEIDLGTETLPTIQRKCERYIVYWRSGMEQQRTRTATQPHGVFPVVAWLAPEVRRQEAIEQLVRRLPVEARRLFQVGLISDGAALLVAILSDNLTSGTDAGQRGPP